MATLGSESLKNGLTSQPAIPNNVKNSFRQRIITVIIEFSELDLKLLINLSTNSQELKNSQWLLQETKSLMLETSNSITSLKERVSSLIGLRTKHSELHIDYLLSSREQKLSFLRDKFVLVPTYNIQNISSLDTIEPKLTLDDFEIISKIGEGGFSAVYLVKMKSNGQFYALKQICKFCEKGQLLEANLLQEKHILASIDSPHIIKLHAAFQSPEFCYFVLDFMPCGDLLALKHSAKKFEELDAKFYIVQVLLALQELHSKDIIYRDLKLENLLVDQNGYIRLCDFGLSVMINKEKPQRKTLCGTTQFMSPEMVSQKGYDHRTDYYSLGVVLYEMVTGRLPFNHASTTQLFHMIMNREPVYHCGLSVELRDFLSKLLCKDPKKRLGSNGGVKEILEHVWLQDFDLEGLKNKTIKSPWVISSSTQSLRTFTGRIDIEETFRKERRSSVQNNKAHMLKNFSYQAEIPIISSISSIGQMKLSSKLTKSTYDEEESSVMKRNSKNFKLINDRTDHDPYLDECGSVIQRVTETKSKVPHPSKIRSELFFSEIFYDFEELIPNKDL